MRATDLGTLARDFSATQPAGWRLWRLELCNWGTFHRKVWSLTPQGGWSLLVGENGSGKSTAVDGLRTLLVPPRLLNYNDASGTQSRRDRSRVSYIRGAWAATSAEDSHLGRTQYLRNEGELSLLLAVFRCAGIPEPVSLAQVLWASDGRPDELFLVARGERTIRDHLSDLKGGKRELRGELRKRGWDCHDSFSGYGAQFRPMLGVPGEGALEVFNQAIGVKEVDDVNRFVRRHLLEAGNVLTFVKETLTPLYKQLLACWDRIKRAEEQIAKLQPISEAHSKAEAARKRIQEITKQLELARPFYLDAERTLRVDLTAELLHAKNTLEESKHTEMGMQKARRETRDRLRAELDSGELGLTLKGLELDIREAESETRRRESAVNELDPHLRALGTSIFTDARALAEQQQHWRGQRKLVEGNREAHKEKQLRLLREWQGYKEDIERISTSVKSLKEHRVNIDDAFLRIRAEVARDAKVPLADLVFAGELIEVRAEHYEWTGAFERLLHGFGLSLLVPDKHILAVSRAVNRRHWGLRLQFFRVPADAPRDIPTPSGNARQVADRLAFKDKHPLSAWVAQEVRRAFPHTCCADEAELDRERYGLTQEGLIRSGTRHVKDDRRHVNDVTNYVLGWSVEDKLRALSQRLVSVQRALDESGEKAAGAGREAATLEKKLQAIDILVAVDSFATLDVAGAKRAGLTLQKKFEELEKSSDQRKELKGQLKATEDLIGEREKELSRLERELGKNEAADSSNRARLAVLETELVDHVDAEFFQLGTLFAELREGAPMTLDSIDGHREAAVKRLQGRESRQTSLVSQALKDMLPAMTTFLHDYGEFTKSLGAREEYAADFVDLLHRLERHELPAHKDRFEEYLNTNLVGNMAMFNSRLDEQLEKARGRIHAVNRSLKQIDFTATTYVQILDRVVTGGDIGPFKARLRECIAGGINPSAEDRVRIFHAIRGLLDEFASQPDWAERVTDVRNWLEFGVRELEREGDRQVDYFSASSGKSGGQKARLAFSILASAILSQYGLAAVGAAQDSTFRLVVIDEVFSRTDEENSRRALDLFQKLGLQLIVVSPFDAKARIVEDYVASYHLALNPERKDSSLQRATREQYEQAWQEPIRPTARV